MNKLIAFLLLLSGTSLSGQMNFQDSSAQVFSYWNLGDSYEYQVSLQTLQYTKSDTIQDETITYDVEVSVVDSSEYSYTVRWFYKNFKTNSPNLIKQKIASVSSDISVDIITNELGTIQSVKNWEEVRDYMQKSIDSVRSDLGNIPELDAIFEQMRGMYSTQYNIESSAIQDALQFHNFHGAKYTLRDTLSFQMLSPNLYDENKPFDTDFFVYLESMDSIYNQYSIRSFQAVNSKQLTDAAHNYMIKMSESLGQEPPSREEFDNFSNSIELVSRIHNTGWLLESLQWKEVSVGDTRQEEIRIMTIK